MRVPAVAALALALWLSGCSEEDGRSTAGQREPASDASSRHVEQRLDDLAQVFRLHQRSAPTRETRRVPMLKPGTATELQRTTDGDLLPMFAESVATPLRARVRLPARASDPLRVTDPRSGLGVSIALRGAAAVPAQTGAGIALYEGALPHVDLFHRPVPFGSEDYLYLRQAIEDDVIRYEVTLTGVHALRLVEGVLEVLDEQGTPRIRMARPYLMDSTGQVMRLAVNVVGCPVDTDPRGPWRRAVQPLSQQGVTETTCGLELDWKGQTPSYPILIDPLWALTGTMVDPRRYHAAALLTTDPPSVLAVGGRTETENPTASAEIYDAATQTWAVTSSMAEGSVWLAATTIGDEVLVTGGTEAEVYDVATGTWPPNLAFPTVPFVTATLLQTGEVLAAGGSATDEAWLYDPTAQTWSATGPMVDGSGGHVAAMLLDGRVLITGLDTGASIYDRSVGPMGSWVATNAMPAEYFESAVRMADGRVVVAFAGYPNYSAGTLVFDPTTEQWSPGPAMLVGREYSALLRLDGNGVVAIGGETWSGAFATATAERWSEGTQQWSPAGSMIFQRKFHTATKLPDGTVLVAGGFNETDGAVPISELLAFGALGSPCSQSVECASAHCVDAVCCESTCDGICQACSAAVKGSGADGTCESVAAGSNPDGDCIATHISSCGAIGTCDGAGSCALYPESTVCGEPSCSAKRSVTRSCVSGTCDPETVDCSPYQCADDGSCRTRCDEDAHCGAGHWCEAEAGECLADIEIGLECERDAQCLTAKCTGGRCSDSPRCVDESSFDPGHGVLTDCAPYVCRSTGCAVECFSAQDCTAGTLCDENGACLPPQQAAGPASTESGCTVASVPARESTRGRGWLLLLGLLGMSFSLRRRAKGAASAGMTLIAGLVGTGCGDPEGRIDTSTGEPSTRQDETPWLTILHAAGRRPDSGPVVRLEPAGSTHVTPVLEDRGSVRVDLPVRADGSTRVTWRGTSFTVAFRMLDVESAEIALERGYARYAATTPAGPDIVHAPGPDGTEDYVLMPSPPELERVRYRLDVTRVAGLRLVERNLEFLDGRGTPRLRMAAPYLVDADQRRFDPRVSVSCPHDTDPRAPWGRTPVSLPDAECDVTIDWSGSGVRYPAALDPAWTTTSKMVTPRWFHSAARLGDGRVLLAGGTKTVNYGNFGNPFLTENTLTAELFDPVTNSFAATQSMAMVRTMGAAAAIDADRVIVMAGGDAMLPYTSSTSEIYDATTGTWAFSANEMSVARSNLAAVQLPDGRVLATGGIDAQATDVFDPTTDTWQQVGDTLDPHADGPALVLLQSGQAMLIGGKDSLFLPGPVSELFDPVTGLWSAASPLITSRLEVRAAVLPSGKVLVAGASAGPIFQAKAEIYDPIGDSWAFAPTLPIVHHMHTLTAMPDGRVLVAAGLTYDDEGFTKASWLYDEPSGVWLSSGDLAEYRIQHSATELLDGSVLIAGGASPVQGPVSQTAERFGLLAQGATCTEDIECQSSTCVSGVCCDTPCDSLCFACTAVLKGQGDDGRCEPVQSGQPAPNSGCTDQGSESCGSTGMCDGDGACQLYPVGLSCGAPGCSAGFEFESVCNGLGSCGEVTSECAPYHCEEDRCADSCASEDDCTSDAHCDESTNACVADFANDEPCAEQSDCSSELCIGGICSDGNICVDEASFIDTDGRRHECSPFACREGCLKSCESVLDCASGFVCDERSVCAASEPDGDSDGCSVHRVGGRGSEAWLMALGLLLALGGRRRRRHA